MARHGFLSASEAYDVLFYFLFNDDLDLEVFDVALASHGYAGPSHFCIYYNVQYLFPWTYQRGDSIKSLRITRFSDFMLQIVQTKS